MADGKAGRPASGRLLNATAIMASGTLVSRILGFVRAGLLVIVLGATTPQAESFSLATVIPNTLYMLVAGGALNTVLVPQIVRHARNDDDGGEAFVNRIMTAFLALLLAVTVIVTVFTPVIIERWANEAWQAPANAVHWQQLLFMAFLTMPQLFFFGAFFLIGQVLNARDKFGPMMWAPILNNVVGIAVLGLYLAIWGSNTNPSEPFTNAQVLLLGLGSTLGIVVQTLALIPSMRKVGFRYRPRWDLRGQGLGATFHLAKWMLGYAVLTTLVQIVVTNLATSATAPLPGEQATQGGAGITVYNTANLVWILPHSLLTVSLATAMLPSAARLATSHDMAGVAAETTRTLRLALTFLVPASFAFIALGLPFSRLAFGYGANAAGGWSAIGWTLMALAVGTIPFTIQYVYLRGFYALEDTRTAFFLQLAISVVNVAAGVALVLAFADPMSVAPRLGLAYSLAYAVGAWLTFRSLRKRLPGLDGRELMGHTAKLGLAVLPGAVAAGAVSMLTLDADLGVVAAGFLGSIIIAGLIFILLARLLRVDEISQLTAALRRRGRGNGEAAADPAQASTEADSSDAGLVLSAEFTDGPDDAEGTDGPLDYPDEDMPLEASVDIGPATEPGMVLDGRFSLGEPLSRRGATVTWRGFDLKLSRPVLLHVMDPDAPRVLEILDQARRAAPAVDSRYLRVWDAVLDEGQGHGSYIVCEYASGQTLESLLRGGPLSDVDAAWIVREMASALIAMHAQGIYHQQLNPSTLLITTSGTVKIVGLLIEQALHPRPAPEDPVSADVLGLGNVLYASLTARWPGPSRYGLAGAPSDPSGRPLVPRALNQTVSTEVSDIVDRILSPVPRGRATRLTSASEIAVALSALLGDADASPHLETLVLDRERALASSRRLVYEEQIWDGDGVSVDDEITDVIERPAETDGAVDPHTDAAPASRWGSSGEDGATEAFSPLDQTAAYPRTPKTLIPPPSSKAGSSAGAGASTPAPRSQATPPVESEIRVSQQAPTQDPPRRWMGVLFGIFMLVLVVGLIGVFANGHLDPRAAAAPGEPYALVSARDFDPGNDGGDDSENPAQVGSTTDGDPATAWRTEHYGRSAFFNDRKPGAGVVVDLGEPREIGWAVVNLGQGLTTGEIRVPRNADAAVPPMDSQASWRRVGSFDASTGEVQVRVDRSTTARFVLVYLKKLPRDGANYVGAIHEIKVTP